MEGNESTQELSKIIGKKRVSMQNKKGAVSGSDVLHAKHMIM